MTNILCIFIIISYVIILQQQSRMAGHSETGVDDMREDPLVELIDDSCTVDFIEIVPLGRTSDDYQIPEFICPVVVLPPDVLQEIKQEPAGDYDCGNPQCHVKQELADEYETESACFTIQVGYILHAQRTDLGISSSLMLCSLCVYHN